MILNNANVFAFSLEHPPSLLPFAWNYDHNISRYLLNQNNKDNTSKINTGTYLSTNDYNNTEICIIKINMHAITITA